MRWRVLLNRMRRAGKGSAVLLGIVLAVGAILSIGLFFVAFVVGRAAMPDASPIAILMTWVGLTFGFLFFWTGGLVTELQQSDSMSIKALLHLPISLSWIFIYNYLGTFVSFSIALFLPAMLGLSLAMLVVFGPPMLLALPLLFGFFLMVTALTYQLRGWLARLMENKRRAKTIVAVVTMSFVLLAQLPNLINMRLNSSHGEGRALRRAVLTARAYDSADLAEAEAELAAYEAHREELEGKLEGWVTRGAMVVPVGWLPFGMRAARDGRVLSSMLCTAGLMAIGAWSLRRAYRKTLEAATGAGSARRRVAVPVLPERKDAGGVLFVERNLAGFSEAESGISLAYLRHMLRKPEFKLVFLRVLILLLVFVLYLPAKANVDGSQVIRSFMAFGASLMAVMSIDQLSLNQFGIDRHAFRALILSPVSRRELLFAKNLALAPIALGFGLVAIIGLEFFVHLDALHFAGACLQIGTAFLLQSLIGNTMSIMAPVRLTDDGLKPRGSKLAFVLRNLLATLLLVLCLSPLLIPIGAEWWFEAPGFPLYFVLHATLFLFALILYRWLIRRQGRLLQESEVRILEVLA
jgi:hypothetical protein